MCGITGYVGYQPAIPRLLTGLTALEYRGYDSGGIATLFEGRISRVRATGKIGNLEEALKDTPLQGTVGIGHTRWATHGRPTEENAHPHVAEGVAVVHNGIVENHRGLSARLAKHGRFCQTPVDTEVVAHLVAHYRDEHDLTPVEAAVRAIRDLEGAFALVILLERNGGHLVVARKGCPLAIGYGSGEMFIGSDALAITPFTNQICYLEEGDVGVIGPGDAEIFDASGTKVERQITHVAGQGVVSKGPHRHFMLAEIHQQPEVVGDTVRSFRDPGTHGIMLPELPFDFADVSRVTLVACGTSYYACLAATYWLQSIAGVSANAHVASEFRYGDHVALPGEVGIVVSQSGETADTLEALRTLQNIGVPTVAIVNVPHSTIAREASVVLRTLAGPEVSVASTKAFATQLSTFACLVIGAARARGRLSSEDELQMIKALDHLPAHISGMLGSSDIAEAASMLAEAKDVLYLGRGAYFPVAMEGALKLKEISYIHAEGYAAGELKHGPIALVDGKVPVVVIAPSGPLFGKTTSNLQEVAARGGKIILISDEEGINACGQHCAHTIRIPSNLHPLVAPIVCTLPVQLLAYHAAVLKGTDVDQPRNLAKSVTVE